MADSEEPKKGSCTFLFKKCTKKFAGRKRRASDSDKGNETQFMLCLRCFIVMKPCVSSIRRRFVGPDSTNKLASGCVYS